MPMYHTLNTHFEPNQKQLQWLNHSVILFQSITNITNMTVVIESFAIITLSLSEAITLIKKKMKVKLPNTIYLSLLLYL